MPQEGGFARSRGPGHQYACITLVMRWQGDVALTELRRIRSPHLDAVEEGRDDLGLEQALGVPTSVGTPPSAVREQAIELGNKGIGLVIDGRIEAPAHLEPRLAPGVPAQRVAENDAPAWSARSRFGGDIGEFHGQTLSEFVVPRCSKQVILILDNVKLFGTTPNNRAAAF